MVSSLNIVILLFVLFYIFHINCNIDAGTVLKVNHVMFEHGNLYWRRLNYLSRLMLMC